MFTVCDWWMVSSDDDTFIFVSAKDIFNHCIHIAWQLCITLPFAVGFVEGVQKPLGIEDNQNRAFTQRDFKRARTAILRQKFQIFLTQRVDEPSLVQDPLQTFPAASLPVVITGYEDALCVEPGNPAGLYFKRILTFSTSRCANRWQAFRIDVITEI